MIFLRFLILLETVFKAALLFLVLLATVEGLGENSLTNSYGFHLLFYWYGLIPIALLGAVIELIYTLKFQPPNTARALFITTIIPAILFIPVLVDDTVIFWWTIIIVCLSSLGLTFYNFRTFRA